MKNSNAARQTRRVALCLGAVILVGFTLAACGPSTGPRVPAGVLRAIGAENQYANVLSQIGGRYVSVTSILNNPNADPHTFEASPQIAEEVSHAQLIVQNGAGYDGFMNELESASPNSSRRVITVQTVLGLRTTPANPHLWYNPTAMLQVASALATTLSSLSPTHATYFAQRLHTFTVSMQPLLFDIAQFRSTHNTAAAAVTEPVADYLLSAMGVHVATPYVFQADIMNGVDPAPEDITYEDALFSRHAVGVLCYNEQVVDSLTTSIRAHAEAARVPVVGVYETMPTPGYTYQSWMQAEFHAIASALTDGTSTEHL